PDGAKVVLPSGSSIRFAKNAHVPITANDGIDIEATSTPTLPEAAEIVLPPNSLVGGSQQFARTPFIASFQTGWLKINLATVHIYYGTGTAGLEQRKKEIRRLTALLADRAKSDSDSDADAYFIALGDFNIVGPEHETMDALRTNDFVIPKPLQTIPGSNVKQDKFYDQIALWNGESSRRKTYTRIRPHRAGVFDFFDVVYRTDEEDIYRPFMRKPGSNDFYSSYSMWRTHQMSDHLPMWVELHVDFAQEYLDEVETDLQAYIDS
ncbi:MAG: endonuclease, partial [Anaerolineae bacterium]|nr:endonuclease [Anaerolineae bacterium]